MWWYGAWWLFTTRIGCTHQHERGYEHRRVHTPPPNAGPPPPPHRHTPPCPPAQPPPCAPRAPCARPRPPSAVRLAATARRARGGHRGVLGGGHPRAAPRRGGGRPRAAARRGGAPRRRREARPRAARRRRPSCRVSGWIEWIAPHSLHSPPRISQTPPTTNLLTHSHSPTQSLTHSLTHSTHSPRRRRRGCRAHRSIS